MEMNNVVVDRVLLVIDNIVRIVHVCFHFQISVHEGLSGTNFDIDLIALLSLN